VKKREEIRNTKTERIELLKREKRRRQEKRIERRELRSARKEMQRTKDWLN